MGAGVGVGVGAAAKTGAAGAAVPTAVLPLPQAARDKQHTNIGRYRLIEVICSSAVIITASLLSKFIAPDRY